MEFVTMDLQADSAQRLAIYRRLEHRNRVVAILRIAVPALGVIVLAVLLVQIYLSSLTGRFGVGSVSVTRENVTIETRTRHASTQRTGDPGQCPERTA